MSSQNELPQAVVQALLRGDKIEAIKLLRDATGGDLKSTLDIVQRYMQGQSQGTKQTAQRQLTHGTYSMGQADRERHSGGDQDPSAKRGSELSDHISQGMSKSRADIAAFMSKERPPTVMPGDSGGQQGVWILIVLFAFIALWYFM